MSRTLAQLLDYSFGDFSRLQETSTSCNMPSFLPGRRGSQRAQVRYHRRLAALDNFYASVALDCNQGFHAVSVTLRYEVSNEE